eukprot:jgi/Chlat1/7031/Chrsp56S06665
MAAAVVLGVLLAAVVGALGAFYWSFWQTVSRKLPLLHRPVQFPAGNMQYFSDFLKGLEDSCKIADPKTGLSSLWLSATQVVVVQRTEQVKEVLQSSTYRKPIPFLARHGIAFLGAHSLAQLTGDDWKGVRRLMMRAFGVADTSKWADDIYSCSLDLVQHFQKVLKVEGEPSVELEVHNALRNVTMDIIGITAFGHHFESVKSMSAGAALSPIVTSFEFLLSEVSKRTFTDAMNPLNWYYWPPTQANWEHAKAKKVVRSAIAQMIQKRRAAISCKEEVHDDFLTRLLLAADEPDIDENGVVQGFVLTDAILSDNIMTMWFGGYDTTSIGLAYTLYLLATNPHIQARAHKEVDEVLGSSRPKYEDLPRLSYTRQIFLEALRLFPPAPLTTRTAVKTLTIGGVTLPPGTQLWLPIWCIGRSKENWGPDADEFKPERFSTAEARASYGNIAFSGGTRNCPGQRFALTESSIILAVLLQNFQFSPVPGFGVKPEMSGFVQAPKGGIKLRVSARR